jgi:tryptophan synthase beta chain
MKNKSLRKGPDSQGYYGDFGGMYSGITLLPSLLELEKAFNEAIKDQDFLDEFDYHLKHFVGRPSPLYYAEGLTKK